MDSGNFRQLLHDQFEWPCEYMFKFVVKSEDEDAVRALLPGAEVTTRPSKTGKYVSVSLKTMMKDPDAVIAVHDQASTIKGLISL